MQRLIHFAIGSTWLLAAGAFSEPLPGSPGEFSLDQSIPASACVDRSYDEPLRPQFHFTACRNWLNDPNGMVFDGAKYHLFFQHNPLATTWGNMTWGHATSSDMVHWTQHDHALRPYRVDRRPGTIYSGAAVVDRDNSLGMQRGEQKTLCAFFTFAGRPRFYQAMAYSTDGGDSWTYWNDGRPIVDNQGFDAEERDPKVFWHEPSRQWVMVLWLRVNPGQVRFFVSKDLVNWKVASDLYRDWAFECMDLVFLPVDGDQKRRLAVLYDASFDYEIGTFDGREFRTQFGPFIAGGGNFYAAQTFNDSPDGRVVQIGWMRGGPDSAAQYRLPFNQQMSFPCELTLRTVDGEPRLYAWPIEEIRTLAADSLVRTDHMLCRGSNLLKNEEPLDLVDLAIEFEPAKTSTLQIQIAGTSLEYDAQSGRLLHNAAGEQGHPVETIAFDDLRPRDGLIRLRLLVDRLSVEVYAFDGQQFYAGYSPPRRDDRPQSISAAGADVRIKHFRLSRLKSAW
ncbi:MAG: glycoside hydrolase family 32 protein [Pirellulales bacterium]|nr:glycoside hydrolase family 32 protein [Pirellulales bacterium]